MLLHPYRLHSPSCIIMISTASWNRPAATLTWRTWPNTVNTVRASVGAGNVLLVDAGDEMQGSLLSNIWQGVPVIDAYSTMGYNAATFGNHEFDWDRMC